MPDKPFDQLLPIEQSIRKALPIAEVNGTRLTIEFVSGFEKFNTRPYHNYESWGQGWRITDHEADIRLEREDLDDAIAAWLELRAEVDS